MLTGHIHGELPVESIEYTTARAAPGSCSLTLPLDPGVSRLSHETFRAGAATAVYIERDARFVWSGPLWDMDVDYAAGTVTAHGEGWMSYYRLRGVHTTKRYEQWDQADIARDLLRHAGTYGYGSLLGQIRYGTETTGVRRDRTYEAAEHKSIGEAVEQLAAVRDGFHFLFEPGWIDGDRPGLGVWFRIRYPVTGRARDLVLSDGVNCDVLGARVGGKDVATFALVTGAGDGPDQMVATSQRWSTVHPRLELIEAASDVTEPATLQAKADAIVRTRSAPIVLPDIELYPDALLGLPILSAGDVVHVSGGRGLVPIDGRWMVTEVRVSVDPTGTEKITATVASLEAFTDA